MSAPDSHVLKGHCPTCGPDREADIVAHHHRRFDDEEVWSEIDYRILQCRGCKSIYFQTDEVFSEDMDYEFNPHTGKSEPYLNHKITYWPAPVNRAKPVWSSELMSVDTDLHSLFDDIYVALNNDLHVLSAIGIRTLFDRASELLNVDPALCFAQKLTELVKLGTIGEAEKRFLSVLTDAGSAAAHRGWKPKPDELSTMMDIIEAFLLRNFVLPARVENLNQSVPARQKPRKATEAGANPPPRGPQTDPD